MIVSTLEMLHKLRTLLPDSCGCSGVLVIDMPHVYYYSTPNKSSSSRKLVPGSSHVFSLFLLNPILGKSFYALHVFFLHNRVEF